MMTTVSLIIIASLAYLFFIFDTSLVYNVDTSFFSSDGFLSFTPSYAVSVSKQPHTIYEVTVANNDVSFTLGDSDVVTGSFSGTSGVMPQAPGTTPKAASLSQMVAWLSSLGYTDAAVAGILGNMAAESGESLDPVASQCRCGAVAPTARCLDSDSGDGHGLFQWDGGRRLNLFQFASDNGTNWWDLSLQQKFFEAEINGSEKNTGGTGVMNVFQDNTDGVLRAAYQFANRYERCAGAKSKRTFEEHQSAPRISHWDKRSGYALDYYNYIKTNAQ